MQKVQCKYCGNDVWKKPSYIKKYKNIFCDRKCHLKYMKSQQPRVQCVVCDTEIVLHGGRKRNSKTGLYFCSNKCKNPYIARNRRWAENPDYHRFRRPILLEGSKYTCQNCGYNDDKRMLDVHHHNGVHKDNSWTNLRCVCVWCHVAHHRGVTELNLPELELISVKEYMDRIPKKKKAKKIYKCDCGNIITPQAHRCVNCATLKSRRVKNRPNSETLLRKISELGYCGTGRYYGVSDNAVRKWLKKDGV